MARVSRKRFKDRYKVGKSSIVPYIQNEGWSERHSRRKQCAAENEKSINEWCHKYGWTMRISNQGHHWIFITNTHKMIEWFPSSGKLVIGKQWDKGIHCHDYRQLLKIFRIIIR